MSINAHREVTTADGRTQTLNDLMEFDHVIYVDDDGNVTEPDDVHAPEAYMFRELPPELWCGWRLMDGYSGQCGYRGPWMHASEFIGGGMADDILSDSFLYVAIVDHENDCWAVAYKFA
jgi:hypothetical protein